MKNPTHHPGYTPIDLKAIQQAIVEGKPVGWLRRNHGISDCLARKIIAGGNETFYIKKKWPGKAKPELCTCCRLRARDYTFLCSYCFQHNTDAEGRAAV